MTESALDPFTIDTTAGAVDCLVLHRHQPLPVCLFLFGGGGEVQNLATIRPMLDEGMASGAIPPMTVACAGVPPFCFYLDHDDARWETLVADQLLAQVRDRVPSADAAGLVGLSMGGYGALKIALSRPTTFGAVAAVAPMIEPSERATGAPPRNRLHYPADAPQALVGGDRDGDLWHHDHPACRARRAGDLTDLAIRIDAGSRDGLNAHDGAEYLHRVLWSLDVAHEYVLWRDADHVGPSIVPRLTAAFSFVGRYLTGDAPAAPSPDELGLKRVLADARARAEHEDETAARVYGVLDV